MFNASFLVINGIYHVGIVRTGKIVITIIRM